MKNRHQLYRGFLQSDDGHICDVLEAQSGMIRFQAEFGLSDAFIERYVNHPQNIVFSERSRIARLGVRISGDRPTVAHIQGNRAVLTLTATQTIPGYPEMDTLKDLFSIGFPVGRLAYCDPDALLTSEEVYEAVRHSQLKLPASTSISGDGSIVITPHNTVCVLKQRLTRDTLEQILLRTDGREILNRYQISQQVGSLVIPPGQGVITTCSMYLNDHYVVLGKGDSPGIELGRHFPAIILDPIKTRGIRIYLEIYNDTRHSIVNPLITARIYKAESSVGNTENDQRSVKKHFAYTYRELRELEKRMDNTPSVHCSYLSKPVAAIPLNGGGIRKAILFQNGPTEPCHLTRAECLLEQSNYTPKSKCNQITAISRLSNYKYAGPMDIAMKYFPNLIENQEIINLIFDGRVRSLYFFEASYEYGPFLSQRDHNRLHDYMQLGIDAYWVSGLNDRLMVHTQRDGKGYFVVPEKLEAFHKAMLFAFYGSNQPLSPEGTSRLGRLLDNLIDFWGPGIGIVTGGGSGVMELVNTLARDRGILSGANFLDITDQSMTTDVDFCQVFQSSCRHSRQKWFEVASFPIFNVGGIGTLEELGITLCNMKLSISEPVPVILFDTEGNGDFWQHIRIQIHEMIRNHRAPQWMKDHLVITSDPDRVVDEYRKRLQLF